MRDSNRIDRFCNTLKILWHCVPDLRFGQLMVIFLEAYKAHENRDFFYAEDDELLEFFAKHIKESM